MNILNTLLANKAIMIVCYVFDAVLIVGAIALFIWYYSKSAKAQTKETAIQTDMFDQVAEKIDDETYVLKEETAPVYEEPQKPSGPRDNLVEHFSNQITQISEEQANTLKSNTVIVNHQVERAPERRRETISNFVGSSVNKTREVSPKETHNVGVNAFQDSTNFLNTIKVATETPTKKAATKPASTAKKSTTKTTK